MKYDKVNPATGAAAPGFSRGSDKYSHNQWSGHSNDGRLVNKGRGPTKGNQDHKPMAVGKPATKDAYRAVPMCHEPGVHAGKDMFKGSSNPQYRGEGGTGRKSFKDPDHINMNGYDMGDGKMSKGKNPVSKPTDPDSMNYGPAKQY
jgi:hypothetical protein